ncbi:mucin-5AC [Culex quinquefasciatus]|uniref:mucin-5AC n=1 Tax=Culex quinquefasciatus TaxID=7176 RepID=UPI0018E2C6B7|nr:mucin-5AC [Culex quinquefasciatus]
MSPYGREMLKFTCVVLLAVAATVSCIPIEPEPSKAGLVRPSPINPDVVSEPLPEEVSTTTTQATRQSNLQKIPARGTKLSATLDQDKSTTEAPAKEKRETATDSTTPAKSNFRRDQPSTPSMAHKQSGVTTTTAEPVSLKTPIVHPSGLKVRRSADEPTTTTNKTPSSTTRGPLPDSGSSSSSSSNDDNSGPHFIRPVPVDQILKNLHEAAPQHHQQVAQHEQAKAIVEATTSSAVDGESSPGTTVNDHKFHRKNKTTTTEAPEEEEEEKDGGEDSKESASEEDDSKQGRQ